MINLPYDKLKCRFCTFIQVKANPNLKHLAVSELAISNSVLQALASPGNLQTLDVVECYKSRVSMNRRKEDPCVIRL